MSQVLTRDFVFTWKIENFSYCPLHENERMTSPVFAVDTWKKRSMQLWLYPRGWKKNKYLSCYAWTCEIQNWKKTSVESYFKIKGSDDCSIKSKTIKFTPVEMGSHGDSQIVTRDEVFQRRTHYLPNDTLTIEYHVWITDKKRKTTTENLDPGPENILTDQILMSSTMHELEGLKNYLNSKQCTAVTHIIIGKKSILWPIRGIRDLGTNRISIPVLPVLAGEPSFLLTFYFDEGNEESNDSSANIEIRRTESDNNNNLFVKCKITALDSENDIKFSMEEVHLFNKNVKNEFSRFTSQVHKTVLRDYLQSTDGVLYLRCEFSYSREGHVYHTGNENAVPPPRLVPPKYTDNEMLNLYASGNFSDITLRVENRSFKAHKNILSTRSPVFRAMFENDMKENNTGVVNIPDVDPDTLDRMLIFLYTNNVNIPGSKEAIKLYTAADKYQALKLKRVCVMFLKTVISISNVCSILSLADLYQEDKLMNAAEEFVHANRNEVLASENWKTFMETNAKLSNSIMFQLLKVEK